MGVSRVDFNGEILMDLTEDTVNPDDLHYGVTAHNAAGEKVSGNDATNAYVLFEEAENLENIESGERLYRTLGKLKKWFYKLGGASVDILDTKEEIEANTEAGKAAGALAMKNMFTALNDNLVSNIYVGTDGKLHKVQGGADTVIPFNNKPKDFSTVLKTTIYAYGSQHAINVNVRLSNGVLSITGGNINTDSIVYPGLNFNKNLMD